MTAAQVTSRLAAWFKLHRVLPEIACICCVVVASRIAASAAQQKGKDSEEDFLQVCRDSYREAVKTLSKQKRPN
jgi:hypothetical protein